MKRLAMMYGLMLTMLYSPGALSQSPSTGYDNWVVECYTYVAEWNQHVRFNFVSTASRQRSIGTKIRVAGGRNYNTILSDSMSSDLLNADFTGFLNVGNLAAFQLYKSSFGQINMQAYENRGGRWVATSVSSNQCSTLGARPW